MRALTIGLIFLLETAAAQTPVRNFLQSAIRAPEVVGYDAQSAYLATQPYELSYLQKLELRGSNRRLNVDRNQFGLRVNPANPWEVKRNREYFRSVESGLAIRRQLALRDELRQRYYAILSFIQQRETLTLAKKADSLLQKEIEILNKQTGSSFFDADDYVDLQLDQIATQTKVDEARYDLLLISNEIALLDSTCRPNWQLAQLPSPEVIVQRVTTLEAARSESLAIQWQRARIEQAQRAFALEKTNINVGFFQTEYDTRSAFLQQFPLNFSFGVTIPVVNPNKPDMARRKLDEIEHQSDLAAAQISDAPKPQALRSRMNQLFAELTQLQQRHHHLRTQSLPLTLQVVKDGDPKVPVRYEAGLLPLEKLILRVQFELYRTYIDYLEAYELLQAQPLINYLSPNLENLE